MKISSLKGRIERAEYAVDPDAVAEAFIRRLLARRARRRRLRHHPRRCSYPRSDGDRPPR